MGLRKNEVFAVKKLKSSLSSSRLQYPLLILLLLVMEGVSTVLTVMEKLGMASGTSAAAPDQHVDGLRKCWFISKHGADVTISHSQSLHAYNRPVIQEKDSTPMLRHPES